LRRAGVDVGHDSAGPFTAKEVHQLAFGLPEQWVGIINRDRWCEHGAAVIEAWRTRVEAEQVQYASGRLNSDNAEPPKRSQPWPVAFYGQPETGRA
jgi:hypothetical protein